LPTLNGVFPATGRSLWLKSDLSGTRELFHFALSEIFFGSVKTHEPASSGAKPGLAARIFRMRLRHQSAAFT